MVKCLFLLFVGLFTFPALAQLSLCHQFNVINPAQEPAVTGPRCRVVGDTFYLEGMVTEDIYYELRDYYPHIKHLELNSYGGLAKAAYLIAELVHTKRLTTNVRKDARCASACTLIYQAGFRRSAHPSVRFLYHAPRLSGFWVEEWLNSRLEIGRSKSLEQLAEQFDQIERETQTFFNELIRYGMRPEFITYYKNLENSETWFKDGNFTRTKDLIISSPKLINYNIVQDFDFRAEVPE